MQLGVEINSVPLDSERVELHAKCCACKTVHTFIVPTKNWESWRAGSGLIQNQFPMLDANQREIMISGICGTCFDNAFRGEE